MAIASGKLVIPFAICSESFMETADSYFLNPPPSVLRCLEAVVLEEIARITLNQESRMARVKVVLSIPMTLPVPDGWEGSDAQYLQRVLEGSPYNVGIRWGAIASELLQAGANISEVKFEEPRV